MEKFTSLSNIELMYIDGGFNASRDWNKIPTFIKNKKYNFFSAPVSHEDEKYCLIIVSSLGFCKALDKSSNITHKFFNSSFRE